MRWTALNLRLCVADLLPVSLRRARVGRVFGTSRFGEAALRHSKAVMGGMAQSGHLPQLVTIDSRRTHDRYLTPCAYWP